MDPVKKETPGSLKLRPQHWDHMLAHVSRVAPEEACGLIAGLGYVAVEVIPIANVLRSPVRYRMDPEEQLEAFNHIEEHGWDLVGIYHSHPAGPATPSARDLAEAAYPGVIHLIWSQSRGVWRCRGFLIEQGQVLEVSLEIHHQAVS